MHLNSKLAHRVVREEVNSPELVWSIVALSLHPPPLFQGPPGHLREVIQN